MALVNVSACLVTRGDVDLDQIIATIKLAGISDIVVWDNSERENLSVYGRYAAIDEAKHEVIYVQDDDCLHRPEGIIEICQSLEAGKIVCNMPANFRHSFYQEHALVGFGAAFLRYAPEQAFQHFTNKWLFNHADEFSSLEEHAQFTSFFRRTCDIVFTGLTPYSMVDVLYEDMPWASADNRMWRQPTHREERGRMLSLIREIRG